MTITIVARDQAIVNHSPVDRLSGIWYYRDARGWVGWWLERKIERAHRLVYGELAKARLLR